MITYLTRHYDVDDLNDITFGMLKKAIAERRKEMKPDDIKGYKLCMNTNKWVVRAEQDGHITILVPATEV